MSDRPSRESRRKFLKAVPAAMATAVGAKVLAQAPGQQNGGPVKVDTIECAEKLIGIDLHSDDEAAISGSLNNRLRTYEQLRQIKIGPEIDPAVIFKPSLPGQEPKGPSTPGAPLRYAKAPA